MPAGYRAKDKRVCGDHDNRCEFSYRDANAIRAPTLTFLLFLITRAFSSFHNSRGVTEGMARLGRTDSGNTDFTFTLVGFFACTLLNSSNAAYTIPCFIPTILFSMLVLKARGHARLLRCMHVSDTYVCACREIWQARTWKKIEQVRLGYGHETRSWF